jgi:hypothetical protein
MTKWLSNLVAAGWLLAAACGGKSGETDATTAKDLKADSDVLEPEGWMPDGSDLSKSDACETGGCGEGWACVTGPDGKPTCIDAVIAACQHVECGRGWWGECYDDMGCWDIWPWCACSGKDVCVYPDTKRLIDPGETSVDVSGMCVPVSELCGNWVCDAAAAGEDCWSCPADCECSEEESCELGQDAKPTCVDPCISACQGIECGGTMASSDSGLDMICGCGECPQGKVCASLPGDELAGMCVEKSTACGLPPNEWMYDFCDASEVCVDGYCVPCSSTCEDKECGPDGCGGECGVCAANAVCTIEAKCQCIPDCKEKECGDDGCGGSCGECGAEQTCNGQAKCVQ